MCIRNYGYKLSADNERENETRWAHSNKSAPNNSRYCNEHIAVHEMDIGVLLVLFNRRLWKERRPLNSIILHYLHETLNTQVDLRFTRKINQLRNKECLMTISMQ